MKMNPEIKTKWLAALRSGKYKQGRGQLRNAEDEYCCLGVLCEVSGLGEWDEQYRESGYSGYNFRLRENPDEFLFYMPGTYEMIRELFGVDNPGVLAVMNDHQRKSFRELADYIEENL